jgi:hypothetical protein
MGAHFRGELERARDVIAFVDSGHRAAEAPGAKLVRDPSVWVEE